VDKKLAQIRQALRGETVIEVATKSSYDDYLNLFQHKYNDFQSATAAAQAFTKN
jgi:hypothetical protein